MYLDLVTLPTVVRGVRGDFTLRRYEVKRGARTFNWDEDRAQHGCAHKSAVSLSSDYDYKNPAGGIPLSVRWFACTSERGRDASCPRFA